jgi:hypothetical protein
MFTRRLPLPSRSFLLLGPREAGKTTCLRQALPRTHWYNLLLDRELLRLMREPGRALRTLQEQKTVTACYAAYLGDTRQQDGPVSVLPVHEFLNELSAGKILPGSRQARPRSGSV